MAYGSTVEEAKAKAYTLTLYAIADDVEKSGHIPNARQNFEANRAHAGRLVTLRAPPGC